jgi:hypothetical protein
MSQSIAEMLEEMEGRKPLAWYDNEAGCFELAGFGYCIESSRVNDFRELCQWIHHLGEKNWVTSEMIAELIEVVCAAKGWNVYERSA